MTDQHTSEQAALAVWEWHERSLRQWAALKKADALRRVAPDMALGDVEDAAAWIWEHYVQTPSLEPTTIAERDEQSLVFARLIQFLRDDVAIDLARKAWGETEFTTRGLLGYGVAWAPDEDTLVVTYPIGAGIGQNVACRVVRRG